jgi:hypothetical protein
MRAFLIALLVATVSWVSFMDVPSVRFASELTPEFFQSLGMLALLCAACMGIVYLIDGEL